MAQGWFLLGAPWDSSGAGRGEALAPASLRENGLAELVDRDLGDAATVIRSSHRDVGTGVLGLAETVRAAEALATDLGDALDAWPHDRPLVVGGDCSILLGIVPALRARLDRVGLWFVDGHPDYLDGHRSETGETADMELAVITGTGADPLVRLAGPPPMIAPGDVVLLGHRTTDLDADSAAEIANMPAGLRTIDAAAAARDPAGAGAQAVGWLAHSEDGAWLHLDLDVLDPAACPAVTYPQAGGLGWDALAALLAPIAHSPRLLGMSVADFRPDLDPSGAVAGRLVDLLREVCAAGR